MQLRKRQGTGTVKTKKVTKPSKRAKRTAPKVLAPKKKRPSVQRQQPAGAPADMRQLCREAGRINAPMGAADLCRSTYGR
ncbi:hypothetical protein ACF09E_34625 [Streptomyces sp. NPDC014891]|uniref:hypothetical protein n=1 Tax=Streptomyces sp. NPDC014891 TaxID=3364929 RepID=UPI0037022A01